MINTYHIVYLFAVESLHSLISSGIGGAGCSAAAGLAGGSVGPVCLPRRAETFGGFDSHQMNISKSKRHTAVDWIHSYVFENK